MRIRPIVTQVEGSERLEKFGVGRNWKSAIKNIIHKMLDNGVSSKHKIYISHAENPDVATMAYEKIVETIPHADISVLPLTPVMITQGGPGCVSIQYILKDPEVTI